MASAPLGSIKDRIKNFEFMRESGSTSPRARSPITSNNESPKTHRRTGTALERDGGERRQMRRSERKEAELRRENEIKALKAEEQSVSPHDIKNVNTQKTPPQLTERQVPRAAPRVTPRVIPREKDKPPEPALRRRNENNGEKPNIQRVEKN